jgi:triosephosphate isomerase (TIM)
MRQPLIAGNWKMNTTIGEAEKLISEIKGALVQAKGVDIVICPPFVALAGAGRLLQRSGLKLGAQNLYFEEKGAFTGEVSASMLEGICQYVILGHSERRQYFQENNEMVSKKVAAALKHGLKPILCVGEVLSEYEAGRTSEIVSAQVWGSLAGIPDAREIAIAYEPVWAIGTGRAATGATANQTIALIRSVVAEIYSGDVAQAMRIVYGGSVTAANIKEFISQNEVDGALVGGASLKAAEFASIVGITAQVRHV